MKVYAVARLSERWEYGYGGQTYSYNEIEIIGAYYNNEEAITQALVNDAEVFEVDVL